MMGWLSFLNPAFLWGGLAASIPVIIHLINRRKARILRFPAVQFVLHSERRVARKYRVKQWLLLALRTLILFLLTTALAEPVLQPRAGDIAAINQRRAVALILDNSMSMAYQTGGTTAWGLAQEAAGLVLQEMRPQDQAVVLPVVASAGPPQTLSSDRERLLQHVSALTSTYQPGTLVAPFQQAYALLKTSQAPKKEIIVITDQTRTPWVGFEPATLKEVDPQIKVTIILVGDGPHLSNTTIRAAHLEQPRVVAGVRTKLIATVVNYGLEDRTRLPIRLLVDDHTLDQRLIDVPKGGSTDVAFDVAFDQPGYRRLVLQLAGDALPVDDSFYMTVPVKPALRVLLIDGDPRTTLVASETFYLMHALNPGHDIHTSPIQPRVVPVEEVEGLRLREFDVVVLANVRTLTSRARAHLMDFVNGGGGLWWFLGDQVDPAVYNRDFFDAPTRLLPARLGTRLDRPEAHPVTLQLQDVKHPVLRPFVGQGQAALAGVRVQHLLTTQTASLPPNTQVLLSLPDGHPLLLAGTAGQGRVFLFTSTADVGWNELPVTTAYLPLTQTGVLYLAGREGNERLGTDERIPHDLVIGLSAEQKETAVTVGNPQGKDVRLFPQEHDGRLEARTAEAKVPGFYRLEVGQETAFVAVNVPLEESDVTPIAGEEIRGKFPGIPFALVHWERGKPVRSPQVEPWSLAGWFLIGLLALMLVEGVCANRLR